MNIEAYDAESLRKLIRSLQQENNALKEKLRKSNIPFEESHPFEEQIALESIKTSDLVDDYTLLKSEAIF